jgi:hypothetical protein
MGNKKKSDKGPKNLKSDAQEKCGSGKGKGKKKKGK